MDNPLVVNRSLMNPAGPPAAAAAAAVNPSAVASGNPSGQPPRSPIKKKASVPPDEITFHENPEYGMADPQDTTAADDAFEITFQENPEYGVPDEQDAFMTTNETYESTTDEPAVAEVLYTVPSEVGAPKAPDADGVNYQVAEKAVVQQIDYAVPEMRSKPRHSASLDSAGGARSSSRPPSVSDMVTDEEPMYQSAEFAFQGMLDHTQQDRANQIYGNAASITQSVVVDPDRVVSCGFFPFKRHDTHTLLQHSDFLTQ
jgi:hypothetical protein